MTNPKPVQRQNNVPMMLTERANNLRQNYVVYAVRRTTNKDSHGIPR
jgi:hypothetical protein